MALISKDFTFSTGATIVAAQFNTNFDTLFNSINGNLNNANIIANANIADTKLAQITTPSKVDGTALTGLDGIPSAAGRIPKENFDTAGGFDVLILDELSASAAVGANQCSLYAKNDGTQTELYYKGEGFAGDEVKITDSGTMAVGVNAALDYSTSTTPQVLSNISNLKVCWGTVAIVAETGTATITQLPFSSSSSYTIQLSFDYPIRSSGPSGVISAEVVDASSFTIRNGTDFADSVFWLAIGT